MRLAPFRAASILLLFHLVPAQRAGWDCLKNNNDIGRRYRGTINVTKSGLKCQRWDTNYPNKVNYAPKTAKARASNFCRNPDNDAGGPWCYLAIGKNSNGNNWENCDIPLCSEKKPENPPNLPTQTPAEAKKCGIEGTQRARITNGIKAFEGQWPWQVHLKVNKQGFCGGTIINEKWILTAAHCVCKQSKVPAQKEYRDGQIYVAIGFHSGSGASRDISKKQRTLGRDFIQARKVIFHPDYNPKTIFNDIALIELKRPITFGQYSRPACLSNYNFDNLIKNDQKCIVSGWGAIEDYYDAIQNSGYQETPVSLLYGEVPIYSNNQCEAKLDQYGGSDQYLQGNNQICAYSETGVDSCQGDSGGPLTCNHDGKSQDGRYGLVGVVSWGFKCGKKTPGVYTRVSAYLDWIRKYTRDIQTISA